MDYRLLDLLRFFHVAEVQMYESRVVVPRAFYTCHCTCDLLNILLNSEGYFGTMMFSIFKTHDKKLTGETVHRLTYSFLV